MVRNLDSGVVGREDAGYVTGLSLALIEFDTTVEQDPIDETVPTVDAWEILLGRDTSS